MRRRALTSAYLDSWAKRCLDVSVTLALVGPALFVVLVVAALIWFLDGGPVLIVQRRVGKGGHTFRMPKFRTMRGDGNEDDLEITRLGSHLRRHRLDELPQFFCVLLGTMTLVGPRPELTQIASEYSARARRRLLAKPGMTGLWQVQATREQPIHAYLGYDLAYLRRASLWLDVVILLRTIRFVIRPRRDQV